MAIYIQGCGQKSGKQVLNCQHLAFDIFADHADFAYFEAGQAVCFSPKWHKIGKSCHLKNWHSVKCSILLSILDGKEKMVKETYFLVPQIAASK